MSAHERFHFRTARGLLAKAEALGLTLPYSKGWDILFTPARIGPATSANRLVVHPMEGADAEAHGAPSELTFRRYRRYGEGGCGLIWFEAAAVAEDGRAHRRQLLVNGTTVDAFKRLAEETRRTARLKNPWARDITLILQLTHSGRFSKPHGAASPIIAQHNPYLDPLHKLPSTYAAISDDALAGLQEMYVAAARRAAAAGFDGVDLKACHGYLVSELLGARARADSRFGGPLENRMRFLVETARAIRSNVPRLLIASRFGAFDALPYPYGFGASPGHPDLFDLVEPLSVIRELRVAGLDLINVTAGIPAYKPHVGRPFDTPAAGGKIPGEHPLEGVCRLMALASEIQRAFPDLPVVGTGYSWLRQFFPHVAAGAIAAGGATFAGLGRLSLAYPDFTADLGKNGSLDPKKICLTCSACSEFLRAGVPVGCVVRDGGFYRKLTPAVVRI
jgi:2,4-dienoyl-CoA reductase (NADPH2)